MPEGEGSGAPAAADGAQFIPVRKIDILDALVEHSSLACDDHGKFRQLCRLLGAISHYEYFDRLERLRADYFYFNPEIEPHARFDDDARERAFADLLEVASGRHDVDQS
jgi:hypothetical protein